jgi:hypothetical protein
LAAALAKGGEPGTAGANFLEIGAGPRGIAMGEAQTAVADDAYAGYWNAAGVSQIQYPVGAAMQNSMGQGISQQYLSYIQPIGVGRALGASVTRLSAGPVASYDANGGSLGSVSAQDFAAAATFGTLLGSVHPESPEIRVGATGRWIQETLAGVSAAAYGGDLGLMVGRLDNAFGDDYRGLKFGLAIRNLGPGLKFYTDDTPQPRTYAASAAWEGRPWGDPATFALEYKDPIDGGSALSFGGEYWVRRVLAVRAGYVMGQDLGLGIRVGIAVKLKRVLIEYAMADFGALGAMQRFGLTCRFGGPADEREKTAADLIDTARNYMSQKRYYEAVTECNRALAIDPGNHAALDLMREALSALEKSSGEGKDAPR